MTARDDWWDFDPEFYRAVHDSNRDSRSKREPPRRGAGSARKGESGGGEANRTDNARTIP